MNELPPQSSVAPCVRSGKQKLARHAGSVDVQPKHVPRGMFGSSATVVQSLSHPVQVHLAGREPIRAPRPRMRPAAGSRSATPTSGKVFARSSMRFSMLEFQREIAPESRGQQEQRPIHGHIGHFRWNRFGRAPRKWRVSALDGGRVAACNAQELRRSR